MQAATYQDWQAAIQKYIGDKAITDFEYEVIEGIKFNPIAHKDNTPEVSGQINWPEQTMLGIEVVESATNQALLKALEYGVQALHISLQDSTDVRKLLNGVHLDYLNTNFSLENDASLRVLSTYLDEEYLGKPLNYITCTKPLSGDWGQAKKTIFESASNDPIGDMIAACKAIQNSDHSPFTIVLDIGYLFFFEIARLRAMRILIANLTDQADYEIHAKVVVSDLDEDHSDYIKKTTAVLSGYIGGANVVKLGQLHDHLDNNTRLEMNIQHILQLESKLNQYKDPMGGSYFMEDLTQQICEKIWNKL